MANSLPMRDYLSIRACFIEEKFIDRKIDRESRFFQCAMLKPPFSGECHDDD